MTAQELQTLFDAKLVEDEPNRFLLAEVQKKLLFKWFVLGFEAASATTPMTVEEKVAKAVFYVDENKDTYRVDWNDPDDRCFLASDENTGEGFTIDYDSIPADAYFLGTVRL